MVILKGMVHGLDVLIRRFRHIYEFSQDERCLLRLSIGESKEDLNLSDGTCVNQGDLIGELHLWNEHIPPVRQEGPDLDWALSFQRQLSFSFRELATYVQTDARCQGVMAFRGELSFGGPYGVAHFTRLAGRWGFDLVCPDDRTGLRRRLMDWGTNLYAWGLIWAFNPASLGGDRAGQLRRDQIWISREVLVQKYGAPNPKPHVDQGEGSASS